MDRRREQAVNEAAARFADTLAESYRIVYEQAAEARERQGRLAKDFSERVMDHLMEQAQSGQAASERLADQARRQQGAGRAFTQESVNAYMDFLDTAFSQYREGTQRAAGSAQEGARAGSQAIADVVGIAADTTRDTADIAAGTAGTMAGAAADVSTAGQPPFADYEEMNVDEITEQLDLLSEAELRRDATTSRATRTGKPSSRR